MSTTSHTVLSDTRPPNHTAQRIIGTIFGAIELILAFRLVFKLLGANPENGFVHGLYTFTQFSVGIYEGIFTRTATNGAFFEPATLIAMAVVALVAWVVLKLIKPREELLSEKTEYTQSSG